MPTGVVRARSLTRTQRRAAQEQIRRQWLPRTWAEAQWSQAALGDARLTRRAVQMGTALARKPQASLPQQMGNWAALKGAYRLLHNRRQQRQVTFEALSTPHWQATRTQARALPVVLLVQDVSTLSLGHYADTMAGLSPIGDGQPGSAGLLLHSTLAVAPGNATGPSPRRVLGLLHQQVFTRQPLAPGQTRQPRLKRPKAERESRVWAQAVTAIGPPPPGVRWVVVADRAADDFYFLDHCRQTGLDFTVRLAYERRLVPAEPCAYLLSTARSWPAQAESVVDVRQRSGRPARQARVRLSGGAVQIRRSCDLRASELPGPRPHPGLALWVVRVWEVDPPADQEPLEWILASSVPAESAEELLERVGWYRLRPTIEDYHQCLKTGTRIEHRDLEAAERVERLLGFLAIVAVRLLQLRDAAQQHPEQRAQTLLEPLRVNLLIRALGRPRQAAARLTIAEFWRGVAQLGGYLGRSRDGPPGWQTLWRGWLELETLVRGAELGMDLNDS